MSTVAEQLRLAREANGLTIYQVAEATKIRTDHVRALEEGNYNVFSATVYIRGFVRTYGMLLKLDVAKLVADLDVELGQTEKFRALPALVEHKRGVLDFVTLQLSKLNWQVALALLIAIVVFGGGFSGYLMWKHHQSVDPLANLTPGVYRPADNFSGETLPVPAPRRP